MNNFKRFKVCKELPKIGNLEAYAEVEADGKHFYIAREVGHWEEHDNLIFCSVCNTPKICKSNFCPNCGAYMREAVEE